MHPTKQKITVANESYLGDIVRLNSQFHIDIDGFKWDRSGYIEREIKKGHYYVSIENDVVIGAINIKKQGDEMFIETIAVDSTRHGSGIGRNLVYFARDLAKKRKCTKLTVESFKSYNLQDFYLIIGFKLDNPSTGDYKGMQFYRFIMVL